MRERTTPYQGHILAGQNVAVRPSRLSGSFVAGMLCGAVLAVIGCGALEARHVCRESFRADARAIEIDLAIAGRWAQPTQYHLETAVDPGRCILYAPDISTFPAGVGSFLLAPGCTPAETAREWLRR